MDESDRMCADLDLCNSERDALRAEVERYKRALEKVAECLDCNCCPLVDRCPVPLSECNHKSKVEWALSEAQEATR